MKIVIFLFNSSFLSSIETALKADTTSKQYTLCKSDHLRGKANLSYPKVQVTRGINPHIILHACYH